MDYLLLQTFLTVTKLGSFSKAAESLNCVQSNITARIKRLEKHFGQRLFERGRGGATLTEFGYHLEEKAQALLSAHQQAESELMDTAGKSARFRLGSMETTAGARLPPALKKLSNTYPQAQLSLLTGTTGELIHKVWERELDAALVAGPIDEKRFHSFIAFKETLVIARPIKGQSQQSLLAFRASCSYRNIANHWLRLLGKVDTNIIEMGTLSGILGCVDAGIGFTVFPESAIHTYRNFDNIAIEALPDSISSVTTYLIWRYDHRPSHIQKSLMEYLQA